MKNLASLFLALSIVSAGSVAFAQDATAPAAAPKKVKKHHHAAKKKAAKPAADATATK